MSWGEPGTGPGEFDLPHCVRVDRHNRVMVADEATTASSFSRLRANISKSGVDSWSQIPSLLMTMTLFTLQSYSSASQF